MIELIIIALLAIVLAIIDRELAEGNEMAALEILTALVKGGMSPIGACAMGGNMMAESGMKSNIVQRGMAKLTDDVYTSFVDHGEGGIDFVHDEVGYGLCQWTYHTRKAALLAWAQQHGNSIGDEGMQVEFCMNEMQNEFHPLWKYLQTSDDIYDAAKLICEEYERPAVNNVETRYGYAKQMYRDYGPILEKIAYGESPGSNVGDIDREPTSYIMPTVKTGEHTPEACFLMAQLKKLGYDVLWLGLDACLRDFQQKRGLEVDGICGEKTWRELM